MFRFTIRDVLWLTVVVAALALGSAGITAGMRSATMRACDYVWNHAIWACMRLEGRNSVSLQ